MFSNDVFNFCLNCNHNIVRYQRLELAANSASCDFWMLDASQTIGLLCVLRSGFRNMRFAAYTGLSKRSTGHGGPTALQLYAPNTTQLGPLRITLHHSSIINSMLEDL